MYSVDQAAMGRAHGCTTGGYGWLYAGIDGARQVADFLDTARKAQIAFSPTNPLWLDAEDYTDGSYPSLEIIRQAVKAAGDAGVAVGIYTAAWWWGPRTGKSIAFAGLPLWEALYTGSPSPDAAPGFGGWPERAGHQWTSDPVDRSVFRARYATP